MTGSSTAIQADDGSPLTPDVDPAALRPPSDVEQPGDAPNLSRLGQAVQSTEVRWIGVTGLFVLAVFYTLYFARAFLFPIVFAILLDFLFSPVIRTLKRFKVPEPLGAALVIVGLLAGLIGAGYQLADPVKAWATRAPATVTAMQSKLRGLRRPVEQVSRTAEQVARAASVNDASAREVVLRGPSLVQRLFGTTQTIIASTVETLLLLYFLLAAGDLFLQKLIKVLPQFRDKKKAVTIARETEASISIYLGTVTMINVGLGIVVGLAMLLLGVPNPALWGTVAGLLEFMPYIGSATMVILLSVVGFSTFPDSTSHALAVPGTYFAINFIQGNFVTPLILGRRLTLNQVAILIGLLFWWWMWGIPGAFIAVPLLAAIKIFCDHIEPLAPVGEFLGR